MIIHNPFIPFPAFKAINLFGIIFVRKNARLSDNDLRHERIHTRQQIELLFVGFFIIYFVEWLYHLLRTRDALLAYRSISFEREAYSHQADPTYLHRRKLFAWCRNV